MTFEEKAYLAGFIDGEGNIGIRHPYATVRIYNTNKPLLDELQKIIGYGTVCLSRKGDKLKGHKPCYRITISSLQAIKFLKEIVPWLRAKRALAEQAIRDCRSTPRYKGYAGIKL